jgi:alcohol-forming fatty acyl-CoA reductase
MSSSISEFYEEKNILVVGSTTFPGKVLLEKLLRSCPNVGKIYCPVRSVRTAGNHHLSPTDTFAEIYATRLFDRVRRLNGKFQEKIVPFDMNMLLSSASTDTSEEKDLHEPNQSKAISCKTLQDNIDLCFYIANNSVDFEEQNLKEMVQTNVMDLKIILNFLKTCTRLKSIVYLSSIYANIGMSLSIGRESSFISTLV